MDNQEMIRGDTKIFSVKPVIICFALLAIFILCFFITGFFINLNSTLSDYSWGDITYINQLFYNFINGRPFQTSVYRLPGAVGGVIDNPFPYANQTGNHLNYTQYAFSFIYALWPNINGLYMIIMLLTYLSVAYFSWKILKHLSPEATLVKFLWVFSVFASSSFLLIIQDKAYPMLFSTPFILAIYYFLIRGRKLAFFLTTVLLCLVQEDAAMFVISLSMYIFFFESKRKEYAYVSLGFAVIYLVLAIFIVQPAARYGLVTESSSLTVHDLKNFHILSVMELIREIQSLLSFLPAFILTYFIFEKAGKPDWGKIIGLILVAPLSHWGIVVLKGGGAHLIPVVICVFLALLLLLAHMEYSKAPFLNFRRFFLCNGILLVFLGLNIYVTRGDTPIPIKNFVKRVSYKGTLVWGNPDRELTEQEEQKNSNITVIKTIQNLPRHQTLVYWTNRNSEAFISNRSDLWRFPVYFDLADFLVIQKDAKESFFQCEFLPGEELKTSLNKGNWHSSGEKVIISEIMVAKIIDELVQKQKTHHILISNQHVVVLERVIRNEFTMPSSTLGFGWVQNLSKLWQRK